MAHFMGSLTGSSAGVVTRGAGMGGVKTAAWGWGGGCATRTYYNKEAGCDYVRVELYEFQGQGISAVLYDGPLAPASIKPASFKPAKPAK